MAMATKTNKFLVLFCSICLFIPLALSAVQNTQLLDSLFILGRERFEKGHSDNATHILLRAQELAENLQDIDQLKSIDRLLAEIYEEQRDYQSANIYLRKLQNIQDSLSLLQSGQILYYEDDETRLIRYQQYVEKLEIDKRNQLILFFIFLVVILIVAGLIIIKREKLSKNRMRRIIDEQTQSLKESNLKLEQEINEKAESEEKFRTIYENAPVMIDAFDEAGKCLLWNKECEKQLGWSKEELDNSGDSLSLIYPDKKEKEQVLKWIKDADGTFHENIAITKDGFTKIQLWANYRLAPDFCLCVGYDITDRKKSENELKESKERYKQLINDSPSLIIEYDPETLEIINCNTAMARSLGTTVNNIKEMGIRKLASEQVVNSRMAIFEKAFKENRTISFEDSNKGKFFYNTVIPLVSQNKTTLQIVSYDITERKKTELELKESEKKFRTIFKNAPIMIDGFDDKGKCLLWNNECKKLLGWTKEELNQVDDPLLYFYPNKRDYEKVLKSIQRSDGKFREYEVRVKDGSIRTQLWADFKLHKNLNISIGYDITGRKQAEIELKERDALLQSMIFSIPLQFYAYGRDGKIFMQSERSLNKLGKLFGMRTDDLPIDETLKKLWNKWVNSAYAGKDVEGNYDIYINDELHHMKTILAPIKKEDEIIGILGTDIDITEMKENEKKLLMTKDDLERMVEEEVEKRKDQYELLIQKSKLESLGQLAAGIAHEINQPIGLIALGLDNIYEKFKSGSDVSEKYLKEKIDKFFKYIERIHQIIDHIGTFSRDQKDITYDEVNINNVIEQALSMIGMQYGDHDIHFDTHLGDDFPMILGNSFKIEQVFLNLLSNSHDALEAKMNDGIEFQKTITIKTFKKGKYIIVEFSDNGIGMTSREIERIFDPFYTTKSPEIGTGLGLSISYGILEEMKAEISVKSVQGEFTTFTIKFHSC